MDEPRQAIFISHASPEQNVFTLWLGAKLAAMGYEVWADVLRLKGGDDWQRKLEDALRNRAAKVLLVADTGSVAKQGVRNEIQIASDIARRIGDTEFIIPLRLGAFDAPFLIAHAQYINFEKSWAAGLAELLEALETTYKVPRSVAHDSGIWRDVHLIHARRVQHHPEALISNWLLMKQLPQAIRHFRFPDGVPQAAIDRSLPGAPWPVIAFERGLLAFAPAHDLQDHFGPALPLKAAGSCPLNRFLDKGWEERGIEPRDARNKFADLARRAMEQFFTEKRLASYQMSGTQLAWWAPADIAPANQVAFQMGQWSGSRQIQGYSAKRRVHWHFGVSVAARSGPVRHVRVISRIIFGGDGQTAFDDPKKMHRLRRSFAKGWRNARWRDMLLAFLHWLGGGHATLTIAVSSEEAIILALPPAQWTAPVRIPLGGDDQEPDEDDPGVEDDIEDYEFDKAEDPTEQTEPTPDAA